MADLHIMIAEDNAAYASGIQSMLEATRMVNVIGIAENGARLLELLNEKQPDIIFMDIQMPEIDGIMATRQIRLSHPDISIIALTMLDAPLKLMEMMQAGATGYIQKNCIQENIAECLTTIARGDFFYCPTTTNRLAYLISQNQLAIKDPTSSFTDIERSIIRLVCREYENEAIEKKLFLSASTYHRYFREICQKMGVKGKAGMMVYAFRNGLDKEEAG